MARTVYRRGVGVVKPIIPNDLEQAVAELRKHMTTSDEIAFSRAHEDGASAMLHFNGGMALRNAWGLWQNETPIARWLQERKIVHGDDRSCVIYTALWRKLNGLIIDDEWIATQAAFYERFWNQSGLTWDMKPLKA